MKLRSKLHAPAAYTGKRAPGTHWMGGGMSPRAGLDAVVKRDNPFPVPAGTRTILKYILHKQDWGGGGTGRIQGQFLDQLSDVRFLDH
jgi:hypothetical protein